MDLDEIWGTRDAICPKNIVEAGTSSETSQLEMGDDSISDWGSDSETAQNTSGSVSGIPSPQGSVPAATNEESGENDTDSADESMPLLPIPLALHGRERQQEVRSRKTTTQVLGHLPGRKKKLTRRSGDQRPGQKKRDYMESLSKLNLSP